MRISGPPNGPVQGKTGNKKNQAKNKRTALAPISAKEAAEHANSKGSKKPKPTQAEKDSEKASSAVWVESTPTKTQVVLTGIRKNPKTRGIVTPGRLKVIDRSPGGTAESLQTTTPSGRMMDRKRKFEVTENIPYDEKISDEESRNNTRASLNFDEPQKSALLALSFFSERQKHNVKTLELPTHSNSLPIVQKSFGPVLITLDDLNAVPLRKSVKKEKAVMGEPADSAVEDLFNGECAAKFHWSHIIAFALLAGKMNTQVSENLFAGTNRANWTKKHYETSLRDILEKNSDVLHIELLGTANLIGESQLGRSESLSYRIVCKNGKSFEGRFDFDTLILKTESSLASKVWKEMISSLIGREEQSQGETPGVSP